MKQLKNFRAKHPFAYITLVLIVMAIAVFVLLEVTNTTHIFHKSSKLATARSKDYKPSSPTSTNQGGAVDKKGAPTPTTETTSSAQWTTSTSGVITLQQPVANTTVNSGDTLRGTAETDTIQYRLVDDKVGIIAQGSLSVVGGKFSGVLQFNAHSTTGELKVFSIDPQSGAEINHADIKINLNP